jgi:drug/metabolite transporter (DMT)-like permease
VSWVPHFALLAVVWGSSFMFIKVALPELHPLYIAFFRVLLGAITLLIIVRVLGHRLPRDRKLWRHLAVVALLGNVIPFSLFAFGEQQVSSGIAGIWNATTPLVMVPVMLLFFRSERMTKAKVAGLVIGFAGVMVVLGVWAGVGEGTLLGHLLCFGAATSYAFTAPYMRQHVAGRDEPGVVLAAGQISLATIELAIIAPIVAGLPPNPLSLSWQVIGSMLVLGALGTGLAFSLNYRVIRIVGTSTMVMVTYLMPIVAVTMGVVVLGEHMDWYQPVGALIVLLGVAVAQGVPGRILARRRPQTA